MDGLEQARCAILPWISCGDEAFCLSRISLAIEEKLGNKTMCIILANAAVCEVALVPIYNASEGDDIPAIAICR